MVQGKSASQKINKKIFMFHKSILSINHEKATNFRQSVAKKMWIFPIGNWISANFVNVIGR